MTKRELKLSVRPIKSLTAYVGNARVHDERQIEQIAASMREFGWTSPLLVDADGTILAGHGRLAAARKIWDEGGAIANVARGMAPCVDVGRLTAKQRRAYVLVDNKLALNAIWDPLLLRDELTTLGKDFAFDLLGFSAPELAAAMDWRPPETVGETTPTRAIADQLSYQVVIECDGERQQAALLGELKERGLTCRPLIL